MVFYDFMLFILSLFAIIIGAELIVNSATKIARYIGASEFIIGMTLVAMGTSLPEFSIAFVSSLKREGIISLSNLIGASIANLTLILGLGVIISNIKIKGVMFKRDSWILFFTTAMLLIFSLDKNLSREEGILLSISFFYYLYDLSKQSIFFTKEFHYKEKYKEDNINLPKHLFFSLIAFGLLYFGANYLIPSTINIASFLRIPEEVIGLSLIAFVTTLPELTVTIVAAKKGMVNLFIGNLIGSNIANILLIVGVASTINPIPFQSLISTIMMFYLLVITFYYVIFSQNSWKNKTLQGLILLAFYIIFIFLIIFLEAI